MVDGNWLDKILQIADQASPTALAVLVMIFGILMALVVLLR